ncbi:MAG: hypothetical protein JNM84_01345 [Planctomycetes bacterium]|nr:hypothetical protein [Planctomycetota bacterium]
MPVARTYEYQIAPLRGCERVTLDDRSLTVTDTRGKVRGRVELSSVTQVQIGDYATRGILCQWIDIHHAGPRVRLRCNCSLRPNDPEGARYRAAAVDLIQTLQVAAPTAQIRSGDIAQWRWLVAAIGGIILLGAIVNLLAIAFLERPPSMRSDMTPVIIGMMAVGVLLIACARPWRR